MLLKRPNQQDPIPSDDENAELQNGEQSSAEESQEPEASKASPQDIQEMNRANAALAEILYKNDASVNSIVNKLGNQDIPIINRVADTTMTLVTQIDKKIDIDEGVLLPFIGNTYEKVVELGQTAQVLQMDDKTKEQGLMVTLEMAMKAYGVSEEEFNEYAESLGMDKAKQLVDHYQQVMS